MRKSVTAAIILCAVTATCQDAAAQAKPSSTDSIIKLYQITPLEKDPSRFVRLQTTTFPPGGGNRFHRHPGDQWFAVQEGELVYTVKGEPPKRFKAGDSVYIPRGTVHQTQNLSGAPVRVIELNIMDKDRPFFEMVPD